MTGVRRQTRDAREDRVAQRRRERERPPLEELRDEEGVSAGPSIERARVEARAGRHAADGLLRQALEDEMAHALRRRQVAEKHAERVLGARLVVSERGDDEALRIVSPSAQVSNEVERGVVRPVKILQDKDPARRPKDAAERR